MSRIATVAVCNDRFASLDPDSLSDGEKASLVQLALSVLAERCNRGRTLGSSKDVRDFLRLRLAGRRNEVFGAIFLTTRLRILDTADLFQGTVDSAAVYPRVVVQRALEVNAVDAR